MGAANLISSAFGGIAKCPAYSWRSGLMQETAGLPLGSRRNEDIALDLMKFIAMTTGYGKTIGSGVGFQGGGAAAKPEDYEGNWTRLNARCLQSVGGK